MPDSPKRTRDPNGGRGAAVEAAQISVGQFLRATRESVELTQAQVAERTQRTPWRLSRAAISAIERGQNFPGLEAMLALSTVLHIDPKELIERARLTAVAEIDPTGLADDELEHRAGQYFWAGDFHRALAVYDSLVQRLASEMDNDAVEVRARLATLEIRRATTLKRAGALISAIASVEKAISLSAHRTSIQAEAYVVLADLQCKRGHLPLARDAADRAIELSSDADPRIAGWAWMVRGQTLFESRDFESARLAFLEAWKLAEKGADTTHQTHIAGNVGMCAAALDRTSEARTWIERAVEFARAHRQPALEASWLIELGKIALGQDQPQEADRLARTAMNVARPRQHHLTIFRAEWLRHRIARAGQESAVDPRRLERLQDLYRQLDEHEGIDEIREFVSEVVESARDRRRGG